MSKSKSGEAITTFLGADATIEGDLNFDGTVRLDGRVAGRISSKSGTVIVGEKAAIEADVAVGVAIVMGRVDGTISAEKRIEIYSPAKVEGDIRAPVISIDAGVQFNGNCTMTPYNAVNETSAPAAGEDASTLPTGEGEEKSKSKVKNFPKNL